MGKSVGVYLTDEQSDKAKAWAEKKYRGKLSAYIAELIERDLAGQVSAPTTDDSEALVTLTAAFAPSLVAEMQDWCRDLPEKDGSRRPRPITQPRLVAKLLDTLLKALPQEIDPSESWEIFTATEYEKLFGDHDATVTETISPPKPNKFAEAQKRYEAKKKRPKTG